MSVPKRRWKTKAGEARTAFIADYLIDGQRHHKQFTRKRDAEIFLASARVEMRSGVHTPNRDSITVTEAGVLWIAACSARDLEPTTINQYRQHLTYHIVPFIGSTRLNAINGPAIHAFEDALRRGDRSPAMVRKPRASLGRFSPMLWTGDYPRATQCGTPEPGATPARSATGDPWKSAATFQHPARLLPLSGPLLAAGARS